MAALTRGDYVSSPVPNTTMQELLRDGVLYKYYLQAVDGYALHDNAGDWTEDIEGGTVIEHQAFFSGSCSFMATYSFAPVQITDPNGNIVTAYGAREFYTIPVSDVPDGHLFGGANNNHEIM